MFSVNPLKNMDEDSEWIWLSPIQNILLSKDGESQLKIINLTLVDSDYLANYLEEHYPNSILDVMQKDKLSSEMLLKDNNTFAICTFLGSPEKCISKWIAKIQHELDILSSSQLGYDSRSNSVGIDLTIRKNNSYAGFLLVDTRKELDGYFQFSKTTSPLALILDDDWKSYCQKVFFDDLLSILRTEKVVKEDWKGTLERATTFIGRSFANQDLSMVFLQRFMAFDTLMEDRGYHGKHKKMLLEKTESLLGNFKIWEKYKFPKKIEKIYEKRSKLVHAGRHIQITEEDVYFLDDILRNILHVLVKNHSSFQDKEALRNHTERYKAINTLNLTYDPSSEGEKIKQRFFLKRLTGEDEEEMSLE